MKVCTFLIFFLFHLGVFAQTTKFNRLYFDTISLLRNIYVTDSGYVTLGGGGENTLYIQICFFDTSGNLIQSKKIRNQGYDTYHGSENSLIKTNGGGYALAGTRIKTGTNIKEVYFVKFDKYLDTIWAKTYLTDTLFVTGNECMQMENYFYITGCTSLINGNYNVLLLKIDSLGNMVWYKNYGGIWTDYGTKVLCTYDKKILIGGYTKSYQSVSAQYAGDWYIVKADSNGTKLWQNNYGNHNFNDGWVRSLIITHDSGFAIGGSIAIEYANYHARFLKLDKNFNTIVDRSYLTPSGSTVLYSLIELNSSDYMTLGTETKNNTKYGFLMKIDSIGNIIWKRNYNATGNLNSSSYALSLSKTPDHGFVFTGYAYDSNGLQMKWLVKTDSLGCDGVHSCDDTTMFVTPLNLPDSVCFGDSAHITFGFGGRSAPYTLHSTNGFLEDSIYYFDSGNDTITRMVSFLPTQVNTQFSFTVTLTDPWGATKTEQYSFYVKNCSTSVAMQNNDLLAFQVWPNPVTDKIHISSVAQTEATILLLNMQGSVIGETNLNNKTATLDLQSLASGVYTVKIIYNSGFVIKRVVKM